MKEIKAFLPIYSRPPNKLIGYTYEHFDDGAGHVAALRMAYYVDKKGTKDQKLHK
jgi:hypothetical protein